MIRALGAGRLIVSGLIVLIVAAGFPPQLVLHHLVRLQKFLTKQIEGRRA